MKSKICILIVIICILINIFIIYNIIRMSIGSNSTKYQGEYDHPLSSSFEGLHTGLQVYRLLDIILYNANEYEENHTLVPPITFNGKTIVFDENNIESYIQSINDVRILISRNNDYTVDFEYNSEIISNIKIEEL